MSKISTDQFNDLASEFRGWRSIVNFHPWNCDEHAMQLWDTVCEQPVIASTKYNHGNLAETKQSARICSVSGGRVVLRSAPTRARAICRCVAAWMEWGEIQEDKTVKV